MPRLIDEPEVTSIDSTWYIPVASQIGVQRILPGNLPFTQLGAGATSRTLDSKQRDIISALDFLTSAEKTDVLAYTYSLDISTNLQKAWDYANTIGAEVWHPSGGYKANNLTLRDHTILRGPLVNRGEWWNSTGKGAVLKNAHSTNNTINGVSGGNATLNSAILGLCFESTTTTGNHVSVPAGTNHLLIAGNSFQGAASAFRSAAGQVYEIRITNNFFQGQSSHCVWESNSSGSGGVDWRLDYNVFRAMGGSALRVDGSDELVLLVFHNNYCDSMAGTSDYVDLVKACRAVSIKHNDFELVAGGVWAVTCRGDGNEIGLNKVTNTAPTANGLRYIAASNSILGPNLVSTGGTVASIDASSSDNIVMWPTGTVTDAGARTTFVGQEQTVSTWTPAADVVTITVNSANYIKSGKRVTLQFDVTWPITADGTAAKLHGLPFTAAVATGGGSLGYTDNATLERVSLDDSTHIGFWKAGATAVINSDLSGNRIYGSITYFCV